MQLAPKLYDDASLRAAGLGKHAVEPIPSSELAYFDEPGLLERADSNEDELDLIAASMGRATRPTDDLCDEEEYCGALPVCRSLLAHRAVIRVVSDPNL